MSFDYSNLVGQKNSSITLSELTQGLDPKKDKKTIERITSVFNAFNSQKATAGEEESLNFDEQMQLLDFYQSADTKEDDSLSRKEIRKARKDAGLDVKYKALKAFMDAYQNIMAQKKENNETMEVSHEGTSVTASQADGDTETQYTYTKTQEGGLEHAHTTYVDSNEGVRYDNLNRLVIHQTDQSTKRYTYASLDDKNPVIVTETMTDGKVSKLERQADGIYKDQNGNLTMIHQDYAGVYEFYDIQRDAQNRTTYEELPSGDAFEYTYSDASSSNPATIARYDKDNNYSKYTLQSDGTYSLDGKPYNYDPDSHTFTEVKPKEPEYKRQAEAQQYKNHGRISYSSNDWRNARVDFDSEQLKESAAAIKSSVNADELLDKMLQAKGVDKSKIDVARLKADLIHNNPSVFADNGDVWSDAKFNKLDFPKDLKNYQAQ